MARLEKVLPRRARSGEKPAPTLRKNLYFDGPLQEEILDYLIWRGNIEPYTMMDGSQARGSTDVIKDLLRRKYLADTLDEVLLRRFSAWRQEQYSRARVAESGEPKLPRLAQRAVSDRRVDPESRRAHFTAAAYGVSEIIRSAIWHSQDGSCAKCSRNDSQLEVHREVTINAPLPSSVTLIALCPTCHQREHNFTPTRGRPPSRQSIISCLT
jgi:5-methylcytosine-specific restriction endonuclease McrA